MDTKKILIAYTTNAGTTDEVALAIGEGISQGRQIYSRCKTDRGGSRRLEPYSTAVIGAPMIFGWHRGARKFIQQHQDFLCQIAVAYFITAMNLTRTDETSLERHPSVGGSGRRQTSKTDGAFLQGTLFPSDQLPATHSQVSAAKSNRWLSLSLAESWLCTK